MLEHDGWPFFTDDHRRFAAEVDAFCARAHALDDAPEANPAALCARWVEALGAAGLLRACVPAAYGGASEKIDVRTLCLARERLAEHHALADFAFAMQGLGSAPISLFGTLEQQQRYLPRVARGEAISAFAISEENAGSDVAALSTAARRDVGAYVLDGAKTWISNTGIASFYVVFARTGEPGHRGISAFIVDADTPGLQTGPPIETMAPHPLGSLRFTQCRVPASNRLGEEGRGFAIAMATLDLFRATVGAAATGFARRAFAAALRRVRERKLFGTRLADMQLTQAAIARMATDIDASALLVYRAAYAKDAGAERVTREAAMAKWFATETASRVADRAMQLFGAYGVVSENEAERVYRDARALRIYEGASEVQQIVIARSLLERA